MKFSVNWLREFVDLPGSVDQLADLLTMAGVEIEGIEPHGANVAHVVVAQIKASAPHPNADRLSVCEVDDGSGTKRQIVCGAKNYKVGDKVPLAQPGAKLPNGLEIRKSKLRGVESEGMLCSPIELGLGDDKSGLLILSPEAKIGAPISELFPSDTILDVEITPNRGDLLSHYGLAREISALAGTSLRGVPGLGRLGETSLPGKNAIKIASPNECPFFSARRIENVRVGPSPQWLRTRIEAAGVRSINNIVDISNYVMLELGQPTHAFDADKLRGDINVRLAREGEKFLALDGRTYSLRTDTVVVADGERAVGIGGVMGGEETGVTESTRNVLLEAAYFLPASVRRSARELSLPSDASYRFERGIDPEMILRASARATELIREIAGGNPAPEILTGGEIPAQPDDVSLAYETSDRLLGVTLEPKVVDETLTRFGLEKKGPGKPVKSNKSGEFAEKTPAAATWKIPSHRRDLQRDVDLIEEVVRAYGVGKIAGSDRSRFTPLSAADRTHDVESLLRERLVGYGLTEVRTSKLISRKALEFEPAPLLKNPLSEDHVALRPSLLAALLDVVVRNVNNGAETIAVFEIGRVFKTDAEEKHLGVLLWGDATGVLDWRATTRRVLDFFDLKGVVTALHDGISFRRLDVPGLAATIWCGEIQIGLARQLEAERTRTMGANSPVYFAELNVDLLRRDAAVSFQELDRFPAVTRDIAMIVPDETTHEAVVRAIENPKEPLLEQVQLFDIFSGGETGAGKKSVAYRLTYRERSRTLTHEEVSAAHGKIRERLRHELGAELRE